MIIKDVTALTVNYNTPDLLKRLLISFRRFYNISFLVIDGSDIKNYGKIKSFRGKFNIKLLHFNYNIHHGRGMAYGIQNIKTKQILLLDSDVVILRKGFIEDFQSKLLSKNYGIGDVSIINDKGVNTNKGFKYLHPSCALINRDVALKYPLPVKHGAPMIAPMKAVDGLDLLQHEPWLAHDLLNSLNKTTQNNHYIIHDWMGTVSRKVLF